MNEISNIFIKKKILIYGLGKSGQSSLSFLRKKKIKFTYLMIKKKIYLKQIKLKRFT